MVFNVLGTQTETNWNFGAKIWNPPLNSREQALHREKTKLTNNGCTCCKFNNPTRTKKKKKSALPATKHRKLRSKDSVFHWCHTRCILNEEGNFKQMPPAVPSLGWSVQMPGAPLNSRVAKKKKIFCRFSHRQSVSLLFIYYLHVIHFMYLSSFNVLLIAVWRIVVGDTNVKSSVKGGSNQGPNCPLHLKSGPGRDDPSFALYWLAAEHFDIPST